MNYKYPSYFLAGMSLIVFALFCPAALMGSGYMLSVHMLSHIILLLLAPPLLVLSLQGNNSPLLRKISRFVSLHLVICWFAGIGIMWVLNVPLLIHSSSVNYRPEAENNLLKYIYPAGLVLAGVVFSWPVLSPVKQYRLYSLSAVLYLFTACICCSLLGLLITFSSPHDYAYHFISGGVCGSATTATTYNAFKDQQMAGLIMWIPGCLIYFTGAMFIILKWFENDQREPVNLKI